MRIGKALMLGILAAMSAVAAAYTPNYAVLEDKTLMNRFPEGATMSREAADQLLTDIRSARTKLKDESEYADRRCAENFFTNSCREDVRQAKLRQESRLQALEVRAKTVVREDKARIEREKQKEREAKKAAGPQKRAAKQAGTKKKPEAANATVQKRQADLEKRRARAEARKAKEAENLKAHEAKLAEREQRAARRAKAQADRAAKEAKK